MSHRFKQSKAPGGNRKNSKSESAESPSELPTELDSAGIFDFLYVDKARISALYAQLFPNGLLTTVKSQATQTFATDQNLGTDLKVLKFDSKASEGGSEGIEHVFDASWVIPLEVLNALRSSGRVRNTPLSGLGSIVLDQCFMRVIDFEGMDRLWGPALRMAGAESAFREHLPPEEAVPLMTEALRALPQAIHAHYLCRNARLWSSLQPNFLTIPRSDFALKYGGSVSGSWWVLYILDSWADDGAPPSTEDWSAGEMIDAILTASHGIRSLAGRPPSWFGITPLLIFRDTNGWLPHIEDESDAQASRSSH